jgi:hypothetical protein
LLGRLLRRAGAAPLPPGPRGRILFVGPFHGGAGGIERLTKTFAAWVEGSGFTATCVFQDGEVGESAYSVRETERLRVLRGRDWGRALETEYDFAYVVPPGLDASLWRKRLARVRGPRVALDLDPKRKLGMVTDVLHRETPRDEPADRPAVVATPDPRATIPDVPPEEPGDFHLTVFTPYGDVKGHRHVREFLEGGDRRLVWCYDPVTFAARKAASADEIRARVAEVSHPRLRTVESPSLAEVYRLYRASLGYVCFSESEGLGWAMLDAMALGKPLAARRIGICRAVNGFRATDDFRKPVFGTYPLPPTEGFEGLFREVPRVLGRDQPPR